MLRTKLVDSGMTKLHGNHSFGLGEMRVYKDESVKHDFIPEHEHYEPHIHIGLNNGHKTIKKNKETEKMVLAKSNSFDEMQANFQNKLKELDNIFDSLALKKKELEEDVKLAIEFAKQSTTQELNEFYEDFQKYQRTPGKSRSYAAPVRELVVIYLLDYEEGLTAIQIGKEIGRAVGQVYAVLRVLCAKYDFVQHVGNKWSLTERGKAVGSAWKEASNGQ